MPGTVTDSPAAGTVLGVGNNQALSATFVPTDSTDSKGASAMATIDVIPVTPGPAGSVSLSGSYNRTGIFADGTSYPGDGGLDGYGYAYSAAQLGTQPTWDGQAFHLGPAGAADAVSATGQRERT